MNQVKINHDVVIAGFILVVCDRGLNLCFSNPGRGRGPHGHALPLWSLRRSVFGMLRVYDL